MCYDIFLSVKVTDEQGAADALNRYIDKTTEEIGWRLGYYAEEGITRDTFAGLCRIFLAGWKCNQYTEKVDSRGYKIIRNSFNASYGWIDALYAFFETIVPYIAKDSVMIIDDEEDTTTLTIRDGEVVYNDEGEREEEEECMSYYDYNKNLIGSEY